MEEKIRNKVILDIIKEVPPVQPPDDFARKVMNEIHGMESGIWSRIMRALMKKRENVFDTEMILRGDATGGQCSFCFFMGGFFYLILGVVLMLGFGKISSGVITAEWVALQPYISFATAIFFGVLGSILLMDGRNPVKVAKLGALMYIAFAVSNGAVIQMSFGAPSAIIFGFTFGIIGVLTGAFLGIMVDGYQRNFLEQKGF
ncbi:MAG: hypothetical protein U9R20_01435 [Thermodesulfobacteriota bacterium]|nr:hypothetical protein [Thermodesulfobacteriota bacterium]